MKLSAVAIVLLTRTFFGELSEALNVTVSPGPVSMCLEGDNMTLTCAVSQRKRSSSVLVLRWLYLPTPEDEHLVVRLGMKKFKYYGNYSKNFTQTKFHFWEEMEEQSYQLLILNVSEEDQGNYTCKVQEIRKHRDKWRASSNGTGSMELRVHRTESTQKADVMWHIFEDLYLCAVLICSIGLFCLLIFAMTISYQNLQRRQRLQASYNLVKSPENSSGETVTSVSSSSPVMHRKEKRHKPPPLRELAEPPSPPPSPPPQIPVKAPAPRKPRRTKLLKTQTAKTQLQRLADDCLTYAELELVKPKVEMKTDPSGSGPLQSNTHCTGTVYAQVLFVEKHV